MRSLLDLEEMLRQVMRSVKKSLPIERMSIYLLVKNREKLELVFFSGLNIQHKLTLDIGDKARPGGSSKTVKTSTFTISRSSMKHSVILSILTTKKSAEGPISGSRSKYIMLRSAKRLMKLSTFQSGPTGTECAKARRRTGRNPTDVRIWISDESFPILNSVSK